MNKKLLALYGLKWNPFAQEVPVEALTPTPRTESFCWRVEQLSGEGGFALVTGDPGTGKSATLRILAERLSAQRDVKVAPSLGHRRASPTSTGSSAISSASSCTRTIAGAAPSSCATAGRRTSTHRSRGPC